MTFVAFSSPRGRHMQREQRIHVRPGPVNAVAVHAVFNGLGYVVSEGSLTRSLLAARKLVHRVMEEADGQPSQHLQRHATLRPMTLGQAQTASNAGGMREYRKALWATVDHHIDHMTRVRALGQLACLAGVLGDED